MHAARDVAMSILGAHGMLAGDEAPLDGAVQLLALSAHAISIAGGTNEVQRNIIGERVLGLPKEPQVDRDVPFRDLKVGTQRRAGGS
jgi:alkylation response protein AidB-like acyl-CoA dehydrogenase